MATLLKAGEVLEVWGSYDPPTRSDVLLREVRNTGQYTRRRDSLA